jgi:alpha-1,4-digalacturonate transport system permease protein
MLRKTFIIILVIIFMLPVFWSVISSFKSISEIYNYPPTVFPSKISFEGYLRVFKDYNFMTYLNNTLFVAVIATVITVLVCIMTGYGLAKGSFPGKQLLTNAMLTTLFITAQIMMVPLFIVHPGQCNREGGESKSRKKGYTSVKFVCEQIYKEV